MEERLNDLEIHMMHLESTLEELNSVVIQQQRSIDALTAELLRVRQQLQEVVPSPIRPPEEETPPPHY